MALCLLLLSACAKKGKAICQCGEGGGNEVLYTLNTTSISLADTECHGIQNQLPYGDSCRAYIDN